MEFSVFSLCRRFMVSFFLFKEFMNWRIFAEYSGDIDNRTETERIVQHMRICNACQEKKKENDIKNGLCTRCRKVWGKINAALKKQLLG